MHVCACGRSVGPLIANGLGSLLYVPDVGHITHRLGIQKNVKEEVG
jgi:hypothetical protein